MSGVPTQPLLPWVLFGIQFFLWCLAGEEKLLKCSVFLGYPFPDGAGFYWDFFVFVLIGISRLLASSAASLGYIFETKKQNKTPGTYYCVVTWVLRSLADLSFSLHVSESSSVCFIYNNQGF